MRTNEYPQHMLSLIIFIFYFLFKSLIWSYTFICFFSNKVLEKSEDLEALGHIQWQLALYLLLAWGIVFLCLLKGIHSAGKVGHYVNPCHAE